MEAEAPGVTVVVTCYQQAAYIEEALDSVAAQDLSDWDLIVTDDASTDGSPDRIRAWRSRHPERSVTLVLHDENVGITRTLNEALPLCRGRHLAYLGGDDLWAPDKLVRLVEALDLAPDAAVAYSDARLVDVDGDELEPSFLAARGHLPAPAGRVFVELLRHNFVIASSAVFRTDAIRAVGGWDPALAFEDWDLLLHLADRWPVVVVPGSLVDYRIHDASVTRSRFGLMLEGRMAVLEKWLGRQPGHDAVILPYLRYQSWRLYKVKPDQARRHVAVAYADAGDLRGRLRYLVATRRVAELGFEGVRRLWRLRSYPRLRLRGGAAYR